jgi:hypothetical protein
VVVLQNRLNAFRYAQAIQRPADGDFDMRTRGSDPRPILSAPRSPYEDPVPEPPEPPAPWAAVPA